MSPQRPDKRLEVREIMKMPQVVFLKMAYADRPGASSGLSTTYGILFFVGFLALCRTVEKGNLAGRRRLSAWAIFLVAAVDLRRGMWPVIAPGTATTIGTYRHSRNPALASPDGSDERARSTMLSLPPSLPSACGVDGPPSGRPSVAGCRIGRFWLVERLGRGCQGDVWKAIQVEPFIESVALKILTRALARDPKRRAQFRREAERGARLAGPSLLPTYEYGEVDGIVYMAMPLVNGCSLHDIVTYRRNPRSPRLPARLHPLAFAPDAEYVRGVARLFARVARALDDVHVARVAHRDIKPSNILLDCGPGDGVFLCDFGLARDLDVATPAQLRDGAGTPLYMPPERLLRSPADEVRCDIYALGATLFEALTLVPVFQV